MDGSQPEHPRSTLKKIAVHTACDYVGVHICVYSPDLSKKSCYCVQEGCVGKSKHCSPILFGTVYVLWWCPYLLNTRQHTCKYTLMHFNVPTNYPICANSMLECIVSACRRYNRCAPVTHSYTRTPT